MVNRQVVSVDLGKHKVGVAAFADADLMIATTLTSRRGTCPEEVAEGIIRWADKQFPEGSISWVVEWPQKYKLKRRYHADLDALHAVGHALWRAMQRRPGFTWLRLRPAEWKGNVPKGAHHKRLLLALTHEEARIAPRPSEHDAWDAIGVGLFYLGRTGRGGVP